MSFYLVWPFTLVYLSATLSISQLKWVYSDVCGRLECEYCGTAFREFMRNLRRCTTCYSFAYSESMSDCQFYIPDDRHHNWANLLVSDIDYHLYTFEQKLWYYFNCSLYIPQAEFWMKKHRLLYFCFMMSLVADVGGFSNLLATWNITYWCTYGSFSSALHQHNTNYSTPDYLYFG